MSMRNPKDTLTMIQDRRMYDAGICVRNVYHQTPITEKTREKGCAFPGIHVNFPAATDKPHISCPDHASLLKMTVKC